MFIIRNEEWEDKKPLKVATWNTPLNVLIKTYKMCKIKRADIVGVGKVAHS